MALRATEAEARRIVRGVASGRPWGAGGYGSEKEDKKRRGRRNEPESAYVPR